MRISLKQLPVSPRTRWACSASLTEEGLQPLAIWLGISWFKLASFKANVVYTSLFLFPNWQPTLICVSQDSGQDAKRQGHSQGHPTSLGYIMSAGILLRNYTCQGESDHFRKIKEHTGPSEVLASAVLCRIVHPKGCGVIRWGLRTEWRRQKRGRR